MISPPPQTLIAAWVRFAQGPTGFTQVRVTGAAASADIDVMTPSLTPTRLGSRQTLAFAVMMMMAVGVAVVSARFLLPHPPLAEAMRGQLAHRPIAFLTHVACGITALVLGGFQFVTRLGPRQGWHRAAGRIYVVACLGGAVSGLIIAWSSFAGPIASVGFSGLAVAWFVTATMGLRAILSGRIAVHRRWMVRSYALTLAAVTLRLMLPFPFLLGLDFVEGYRAISFLCWIPNLILAEVWLRATAGRVSPGLAMDDGGL